jgi:hypothetical protein
MANPVTSKPQFLKRINLEDSAISRYSDLQAASRAETGYNQPTKPGTYKKATNIR